MKKIIIAMLLLVLPLSLFAEFYLGVSALYKGDPMGLGAYTGDPATIVDNLGFGLDAKLKLSIFEAQALALYNLDQSFNTFLDVGIVIDIAIVSIGAGVGPNFIIDFASGTPEPFGFGFNGKVHVDLNLGSVKISAYYLFLLDSISVADIQSRMYAGNVGLSVLIQLF